MRCDSNIEDFLCFIAQSEAAALDAAAAARARADDAQIAHRLRTIVAYEKVLVMEAGRVAEAGAPAELLARDAGYLRALVEKNHG